ncbi:MAG: glycosyltransferase family 9 protein, partial [Verrucomicrobia bacterium]|nr:glycosyltransferase family 9 protein [Verrucomicrobiota bacterium]
MSTTKIAPRILIIRRRYLGDIVLLGPVLKSLRNHWPEAKLAVMVDRAFAPILSLNPDVDQTLLIPTNLTGWISLIPALRRARFTHVLDLDNRPRTAVITRFSGAPTRIALHHGPEVKLPRCYTAHEIIEADYLVNRHITDFCGRILRPIGVPFIPSAPKLIPRAEDIDFVRNLPAISSLPVGTAKILIHPGSRSPHRIWPAERFAAVINQLRNAGVSPILVAGPGEKEVVQQIQSHLTTPALAIDQRLTIPQLAALFASANTLLCHDSGPMHLAASVGTRVVALFSSQNVATWRPLGEKHLTLQAPMPCNPCLSPGFCVPSDSYHNHCVRHLSVDQVF